MRRILNEAADRVWYWWEENKAVDEDFDTDAQKVCAFADFIEELDDDDDSLLSIADIDTTHDYVAEALRKIINKGIDDYLGNPVEKMLAATRALSNKLN